MDKSKSEETVKIRFNPNNLVAVLLAIVFVVSAFQTMQLSSISSKLAGQEAAIAGLKGAGNVSLPAGTANVQAAAQGQPAIPSSLQNLPNMVGGC